MSLRVALAPLLLVVACAGGETGPNSGSASMPTMPGYMPTTADDATDPADTTDDPATSAPSTDPQDPTTSSDPATSDVSATFTTTLPDPDTGDDTTGAPPVTSTTTTDPNPGCAEPCDDPPGPCFDSPGNCINDLCDYPPSADGVACDDGNPCTDSDSCNGAGSCTGLAKACPTPPNATGGSCQNGTCGGFTCVDPYENCDGDWANGCEVPTGVPNRCSVNGLTDSGCWTAYCGANPSADASFGTYHCVDCVNCHEPVDGQWQWCNHTNGTFYDPAAGNCPAADQDKICTL